MADSAREPGLGAEPQAAVFAAEDDVTRHERPVLGEPVHDLRRTPARKGLDAAGQRVARPEHVRDRFRPALDRRAGAARGVQPPAVAADDLAGAARVPEHRDEHMDRDTCAPHIPVQRLPEPCGFGRLRRHERVDQDDRVGCLEVHAADLVVPFLVVGGPAPEPLRDPRDLHGSRD